MVSAANLAAQRKLADAVQALIDSNPDGWYPQALAFLGAAREQAEGELETRLDDSGAAAIEFELISDIGDLAGYYPEDWLARVVRFALLVDLKLKEPK